MRFGPGNFRFFYFPHADLSAAVKEDRVSKDQAERQVVHQRFQTAGTVGLRKIRVHPAPVTSVAVAGVVALDAKTQGLAADLLGVKHDFAGKCGVRMRRAGEANPTLVAERCAKVRMDMQIPGDVVTLGVNISPAPALFNPAFGGAAVEGNLSACA